MNIVYQLLLVKLCKILICWFELEKLAIYGAILNSNLSSTIVGILMYASYLYLFILGINIIYSSVKLIHTICTHCDGYKNSKKYLLELHILRKLWYNVGYRFYSFFSKKNIVKYSEIACSFLNGIEFVWNFLRKTSMYITYLIFSKRCKI